MSPYKSKEENRFYASRQWKYARRVALERAGFSCERCNQVGRMEVHHRKPLRDNPALSLEQSNLEVLCRRCHHEATPNNRNKLRKLSPELKRWKDFMKEEYGT